MRENDTRSGVQSDIDGSLLRGWIRMANEASGIRDDKVARVREAIRTDRYDVTEFLDEAIGRLEMDITLR